MGVHHVYIVVQVVTERVPDPPLDGLQADSILGIQSTSGCFCLAHHLALSIFDGYETCTITLVSAGEHHLLQEFRDVFFLLFDVAFHETLRFQCIFMALFQNLVIGEDGPQVAQVYPFFEYYFLGRVCWALFPDVRLG